MIDLRKLLTTTLVVANSQFAIKKVLGQAATFLEKIDQDKIPSSEYQLNLSVTQEV